jgi:hypothetical protein
MLYENSSIPEAKVWTANKNLSTRITPTCLKRWRQESLGLEAVGPGIPTPRVSIGLYGLVIWPIIGGSLKRVASMIISSNNNNCRIQFKLLMPYLQIYFLKLWIRQTIYLSYFHTVLILMRWSGAFKNIWIFIRIFFDWIFE